MQTTTAQGESRYLPVRDSTGTRNLHYCTDGDGPVTVLFEAGLGKSRSTWSLTQPALARHARTVSYDRAGLGRSDVARRARTFDALLDDHLRMLDEVVDTPCLLVGHSYGGPIVRRAALERPDKVIGVVLVDEVSEISGAAKLQKGMSGAGLLYGMQVNLARIGLQTRALRRTYFRHLDGAALREATEEGGRVSATKSARSEWKHMIAGLHDLEASGPHVPDTYVTEITALRSADPEKLERDWIYQSHRDTVTAAPAGRHVLAKKRGHYVQLTDPQTVVDETIAALDLLAAA